MSEGIRTISELNYNALANYLGEHEYDIALGRRDYGSLMGLFIEIFGREPEE